MRRYAQTVQNIEISVEFPEEPLYVTGDASQITQVFMNLILNAEEALRQSNGGKIIVTASEDREWARISVADNGSGIPPDQMNQVFYPFYTTKQVGEGTGLGLSVCYGIITGHNGLIHAENNSMGGATFMVELPVADADRYDIEQPEAELTAGSSV
jgi:signal transduction histidine kinase